MVELGAAEEMAILLVGATYSAEVWLLLDDASCEEVAGADGAAGVDST